MYVISGGVVQLARPDWANLDKHQITFNYGSTIVYNEAWTTHELLHLSAIKTLRVAKPFTLVDLACVVIGYSGDRVIRVADNSGDAVSLTLKLDLTELPAVGAFLIVKCAQVSDTGGCSLRAIEATSVARRDPSLPVFEALRAWNAGADSVHFISNVCNQPYATKLVKINTLEATAPGAHVSIVGRVTDAGAVTTALGITKQDVRIIDESGFVVTLTLQFEPNRAVAEGDVVAAYNIILTDVGHRSLLATSAESVEFVASTKPAAANLLTWYDSDDGVACTPISISLFGDFTGGADDSEPAARAAPGPALAN